MKKSIFTFLSIIMITLTSNAQYGSLEFRLGASSPFGDYAGNNPDQSKDGLAKTGLFYSLEYTYWVSDLAGISLLSSNSVNPIDVDALGKSLDQSFASGSSYTIDSEGWGLNIFGIGPSLKTDLSEGIRIKSHAIFGLAFGRSPSLDITISDVNQQAIKQTMPADNNTSFGYQIGGGLEFSVSNSIDIGINADYIGANIEFTSTTTTTGNGRTLILENKGSQSMTAFLVGIGINYNFGQ